MSEGLRTIVTADKSVEFLLNAIVRKLESIIFPIYHEIKAIKDKHKAVDLGDVFEESWGFKKWVVLSSGNALLTNLPSGEHPFAFHALRDTSGNFLPSSISNVLVMPIIEKDRSVSLQWTTSTITATVTKMGGARKTNITYLIMQYKESS